MVYKWCTPQIPESHSVHKGHFGCTIGDGVECLASSQRRMWCSATDMDGSKIAKNRRHGNDQCPTSFTIGYPKTDALSAFSPFRWQVLVLGWNTINMIRSYKTPIFRLFLRKFQCSTPGLLVDCETHFREPPQRAGHCCEWEVAGWAGDSERIPWGRGMAG